MLGLKNHFDISGSIEIREVDIAGVACILFLAINYLIFGHKKKKNYLIFGHIITLFLAIKLPYFWP